MYIYGKNIVKETLSAKKRIIKAYINKKTKEKELIEELKRNHIHINFVEEKILNKMVDGNHQGFILEVDEIESYPLDILWKTENNHQPLVVLLDHLEDPHNFGAIIRTSEALGVDAIIIPNDRSVGITGTVVKTSAGAIQYTKIIRVPNLNTAIHKLKEHNYWIVGTDLEGEDYSTLDYNIPIGLVIGNEGKGMSQVIKSSCDFIATIPMEGKINSLNASVSCAIILSEIKRKRRTIAK